MEIRIGKDFDRSEIQIIFLERQEGIITAYNFYTGEALTLEKGKPIDGKFILRIPEFIFPDLLKAMADLLEKERIQTDSQAKREGELLATKSHLEDLRKLLKLK